MRNEPCPHEEAVLEARKTDQWEDPLKTHAASCAECREAVRIAGWMQTLAATAAERRPLPDADLLWIKARLFARQAAEDRAMQPLILGDMLARAIVGAFAAAWLALSWPGMQSYLLGLWNASGPGSLAEASVNPWPITLVSAGAALALLGIVRVVHPLLTRN
jgi:hypothetical protein